jgi:transcription elongation factor Elf1
MRKKHHLERSFRCPECWRGYNSASTVENHRRKSQGECIIYNPGKATGIATFRKKHGIAERLPLPERETL